MTFLSDGPRAGRFPTLLFAIAALLQGWAASAATITVDVHFDESDGSCSDGDCSLSDAISTASPGDTILLPEGGYAVRHEIWLSKDLTIRGAGARKTFLDGNSVGVLMFNVTELEATVEMTDLTITGGSSSLGGALINQGNLTLRRCAITDSYSATGAAVVNFSRTLIIDQCTLAGNRSSGGGAVYSYGGTVIVSNSTVSGNSAASSGGGIFIDSGFARIVNSTITANSAPPEWGGGLYTGENAQVELVNSLVSGNAGGDCNPASQVWSAIHSLDSDGSCLFPGPLSGVDPLLGPLADNGGPTDTHAPRVGSPALDAGDDAVCAAAPIGGIDQRGISRPQGSHCDIGAVELMQAPADADGDGVPDGEDACPASDLTPTVVVDGCDSGVSNRLLPSGCTLSDLITQVAAGAGNHGAFVSGVSHLTNGIEGYNVITGAQRGAIQHCAAQGTSHKFQELQQE